MSVFHEHERFLRVEAPRIGSLALLLVGLFTFVFWVRRRHESVYALFFVATALWAFRSLHYYLPHYPQPSDWFWWGTVNSLSWLAVTVYLFAFRLQGQRWRRTEQTLIGAAVLQSLASLPPIGNDAWVAQLLTYTLQMLLDLAITVILTVVAFRFRSREHTLLVVALWLMFLMGAYDLLLFRWQIGFEHVFLQPYSALPLFAAFIYAMARRYRRAIDEAESLNRSLEQRLGERQRELGASYERLRDYEISHAQGEERQRLMREMHDGIGSTLVATLALVERGNSTPELLARSLREAVDELRLTIDSLEPVDHDLVTLLATVRYRLAPRLERAGLEVDWRVSDLPPLDWLDARSALQILRILQEAVTNVLKHAGATRIEVSTTIDTQVCVRIADNGSGFDVVAMQPGGSRGLRNMRLRALQIGATLQWESGPQGTTVSLQLPLSA